jgi:NAD+ dependent glucose-6-phosphate dehydrogenase
MRVLLTGSTGNLGQKATSALLVAGVDLVRIGRNGTNDPGVITADLGVWGDWVRHFEGVDVVLHLAADPRAAGDWDTVAPLNIDLALNVLRASREAGVPRFVFASSNWVFGGYRFRSDRLTQALSPRPINPYGTSKLFIERQGHALTQQGLNFLSLRIGYCQPGENRPGPHMAFGLWGQQMWLGNEDWAQAVTRSCTAPFRGFQAVNIVSDNRGMRWDLSEAKAAIGYVPTQSHSPKLSLSGWLKDLGARVREATFPSGAAAPSIGRRW